MRRLEIKCNYLSPKFETSNVLVDLSSCMFCVETLYRDLPECVCHKSSIAYFHSLATERYKAFHNITLKNRHSKSNDAKTERKLIPIVIS